MCLELLIYWISTLIKNTALDTLGLYKGNWRLKKYHGKDDGNRLKYKLGAPVVAQWVKNLTAEVQVRSPAWHSGVKRSSIAATEA